MNNKGYIAERFKTGTIYIDSYDGKNFVGRLWYPASGDEQKFENLMQLIEEIDASVKTLGFPDEYNRLRSFDTQEETAVAQDESVVAPTPEAGALATFEIKIIFLQNATWQGIVKWDDKDMEENFRSMRELIYLMDSALACVSDDR